MGGGGGGAYNNECLLSLRRHIKCPKNKRWAVVHNRVGGGGGGGGACA